MGLMDSRDDVFRVIFVCTGNICRSPMADVVFRQLAERAGLGDRIASASAGTGEWHVGERADKRTREALTRRGYDGEAHRARQFVAADFTRFDLVVALDRSHERILQNWAVDESESDRISLLSTYDPTIGAEDVPDPYYAGPEMFDDVLGMIEHATAALFRQLEPALRSPLRSRPSAT